MANDSGSRPVIGEIIGTPSGMANRRPADAVDAHFETVAADISLPPSHFAPERGTALGGIAFLGGAGETGGSERGGPAFWVTGLLAVAAAFWFSGGHAAFLGPKSTPVGAIPAGFEMLDLTSRVERVNGRAVLLVDGAVQNTGMAAAPSPRVILNVESDNGSTTRYLLGFGSGSLEPGDTSSFSSRLDAPKGGVKRVYATFEETE